MWDYDLKTAFRIYDTAEKKTKNKCPGYCCESVLISPNNRLLPFMFRRSSNPYLLTEIKVVCCDNESSYIDILPYILTTPPGQSDIKYKTVGSIDYVYYMGLYNFKGGSILQCGAYYLQITDGINIWESESFKVQDIDNLSDSGNMILINDFGDKLLHNSGIVLFTD